MFECFTKKFIRIDYLPGGFDHKTVPTGPWQEVPCVQYHPDLNGETQMRDVKPLLISHLKDHHSKLLMVIKFYGKVGNLEYHQILEKVLLFMIVGLKVDKHFIEFPYQK